MNTLDILRCSLRHGRSDLYGITEREHVPGSNGTWRITHRTTCAICGRPATPQTEDKDAKGATT